MSAAVALPPALFDLEAPVAPEPIVIRRRTGHQLAVHYRTAGGADIRCTCGEGAGGPKFDVTKWVYRHLGVEYDTDVDRAVAGAVS